MDVILQMWPLAIPTMRYVKDEAQNPLTRIGPLREKSSDGIRVFSGNHGRTLIDEMRQGFSGSMPPASFAELNATTWDLWQARHHQEAMEMHGKTLLILTEVDAYGFESLKYILYLRGVFKAYGVRRLAGAPPVSPLSEEGKRSIRDALDYLKPYLRAQEKQSHHRRANDENEYNPPWFLGRFRDGGRIGDYPTRGSRRSGGRR